MEGRARTVGMVVVEDLVEVHDCMIFSCLRPSAG